LHSAKNFILGWGLLLIIGFMFWYGGRSDNLVNKIIYPPTPTPTSDTRARVGEIVKVDGLELTVVNAWRVVRSQDFLDLGIITVKFKGGKGCYNPENESICSFDKSNFSLIDSQGKEQLVSQPPNKFIQETKIVQLAPFRSLTPLTSEIGQIYWLLNKKDNGFTLIYKTKQGKVVRFLINPKTYTKADTVWISKMNVYLKFTVMEG